MIQLDNLWITTERGIIWLSDEINHVAWFNLPGSEQRLEVSVNPDNYPGLLVRVLSPERSTDEYLAEHINSHLVGWKVRKCNLEGVNVSAQGYIE